MPTRVRSRRLLNFAASPHYLGCEVQLEDFAGRITRFSLEPQQMYDLADRLISLLGAHHERRQAKEQTCKLATTVRQGELANSSQDLAELLRTSLAKLRETYSRLD